ncbi:MAG: BON domain-containing protein [Proteobacteria bacterium]|nr:MAG: BON domain-containing protein [Pseudomonadota bacterium]
MKSSNSALSALFLTATLVSGAGLVSIAGCASTQTQSGTGEYFDDTVVTTKVKAAILRDPMLKVLDINVETFRGVVQLSGFVGSQSEIDRAVTVARGVAGVKSVKNDMKMK